MRLTMIGIALIGSMAAIGLTKPRPSFASDPFSLYFLGLNAPDHETLPTAGGSPSGLLPPLRWAFPGFRPGIQAQYLAVMELRSMLEAGDWRQAFDRATAAISKARTADEPVIAPLVLTILGALQKDDALAPSALEYLMDNACTDGLASPTALVFANRGNGFAVSPNSIIARVIHHGFDRSLPACRIEPKTRPHASGGALLARRD